MRVLKVGDFVILKGDKSAEHKYRSVLSKLIISKYGNYTHSADVVSEILCFCRDFYIAEFKKILVNENSYSFYKDIVWLHEQATSLRYAEEYNYLPKYIDKSYVAEYRRILKMIIEYGCYEVMLGKEKVGPNCQSRNHQVINNLLFLGSTLICISESIAEQEMIEDSIDISFDAKKMYIFRRRHHYEIVFEYIREKQEKEDTKYIVDERAREDFVIAIQEGFGFDFDELLKNVFFAMGLLKFEFGDCFMVERKVLIDYLLNNIDVNRHSLELFLSGLTLTKKNKLDLATYLRKPYSMDKYLYRPLLLWTIDQKDCFVFGAASLYEAELSLYLNAIPWGKFPSEWFGNKEFTKYKNRKQLEHDKWLDDQIENQIKRTGLIYQRSVKKLVTKEKTYSLEVKDLGEIDFLIVSPSLGKVFIAECKHLQGRYDMVNQKEDFDRFTKDLRDNSFNTRLRLKVKWIQENKSILEEHLKLRNKKLDISLDSYQIEGVFFINTPTFYMYNSDFRIYTFDQVAGVLTGEHIDATFTFTVENPDGWVSYLVRHPFFRKPIVYYYNDDDDDCEIDKYGFPIKA